MTTPVNSYANPLPVRYTTPELEEARRLLRCASAAIKKSAEQHWRSGDGDGHGTMCEAIAEEIDKFL